MKQEGLVDLRGDLENCLVPAKDSSGNQSEVLPIKASGRSSRCL
jgi:hypothetical protein